MDKKITDLDQEIEKKVIDDRQKDYGNYQENKYKNSNKKNS